MLSELFLAIFLGILFGCITGMTPGIHVNLVSFLVVSISFSLLKIFEPITLGVFIVAMAVTQTFLDTLPAVYLGAPDPDEVLLVLPGHKLMLEGRAYEAIRLTVIGSLYSLIVSVLLIIPLVFVIDDIAPFLLKYIAYILIVVVLLLIIREKKNRLWALILFMLAGVLGLGSSRLNIDNVLFPLLSGLFGTSNLFLSIKEKVVIPEQNYKFEKLGFIIKIKAIASSVFAGGLVSFLPGIGSSEAAIIASETAGKIGNRGFLLMIGGINTVNFVLSFVSLFVLDKARNGAIVAVKQIINSFGVNELLLFVGVALFCGGIAVILALNFAKVFSKIMAKVNYSLLCAYVIFGIFLLVFILSGALGVLVLVVSTFVGLLPPLLGIGRHHLMGCLILPIILFFLL